MNFSKEEYKTRLKKVQSAMKKKRTRASNFTRYCKYELPHRL